MNKRFFILLFLAFVATYGQIFTDIRDGKRYRTVVIGHQTWMAENLDYNASGSKCYDNKPANCYKYGRLYNWETAKKSCPKGWHLPNDVEWEVLAVAVGGEKTEGKLLKATKGWNSYQGKSGNGEDKFGFAALPGGLGRSDGYFGDVGIIGYWWSSSEYNASGAYGGGMYFDDDGVDGGSYNKGDNLFNVRCVMDK